MSKRDRKDEAAAVAGEQKTHELGVTLADTKSTVLAELPPIHNGWDLDREPPAPIAASRIFPGVAFLVAAVKRCGGNLSNVAKLADVGRSTLDRWATMIPELDEAIKESRESFVDELEDLLIDQARKGNIAAIIFGLKTQGKARGYIESNRLEVSGTVTTRERNPQADARYLADVAAAYAELQGPATNPGLEPGADPDVIDGEFSDESDPGGRQVAE